MNIRLLRLPLAIAALVAAVIFFTHRSQPHAIAPTQVQDQVPQAQAVEQPGSSDQSQSANEDGDSSGAGTFHGYACTEDCSGHEAGYNWAQEHDITDRDDCPIDPHNSHSFTEGCWAYADEQNGTGNSDDTSP